MIFSFLLVQINLKNLLQNLKFYTLKHEIKLNRVQKTIDLMSVDLILARNAAKMLFKANMIKKIRKKTKENINEENFKYYPNVF